MAITKAQASNLPQGFSEVPSDLKPRMLVSSHGLDKTGKTNFGLTAPGPLAVVSLDIGLEGVVQKWSKKKKIWLAEFNVPPLYDDNPQRQVVMTPQKTYLDYFNRVREAYDRAFDHKDVRSVMLDTGDEMWELMRLAEFGQLNPAADIKRAYNSLNALYRGLIRTAYSSDKNFILTHKVKKNYIKKSVVKGSTVQESDVWDGNYNRAGFGDTAFLMQVNIEHFHRNGEFGIRIINSRQNMSIAGMELPEKECTFPHLGTYVFDAAYPNLEDWS